MTYSGFPAYCTQPTEKFYYKPLYFRSTQPSTLRGTVNEYQLSG